MHFFCTLLDTEVNRSSLVDDERIFTNAHFVIELQDELVAGMDMSCSPMSIVGSPAADSPFLRSKRGYASPYASPKAPMRNSTLRQHRSSPYQARRVEPLLGIVRATDRDSTSGSLVHRSASTATQIVMTSRAPHFKIRCPVNGMWEVQEVNKRSFVSCVLCSLHPLSYVLFFGSYRGEWMCSRLLCSFCTTLKRENRY